MYFFHQSYFKTKNYKHNCTNKIMWHFATLLLVKLVPFFNLHYIENKHFIFVYKLLFFWKNMYLRFTSIIKLHSLVLSLYLSFSDVYINKYHLSYTKNIIFFFQFFSPLPTAFNQTSKKDQFNLKCTSRLSRI